jgi:hypothetical protein
VAIVESLATLVGNIGNYQGREYQELKRRVLAAHGRSRWKKLDSLLSFPKMGANERPSVVLSWLNSLKPATLEELYMAIFLHVLPDSYREHFAHCKLRTGEELAAKADSLWEMRGGRCGRCHVLCLPSQALSGPLAARWRQRWRWRPPQQQQGPWQRPWRRLRQRWPRRWTAARLVPNTWGSPAAQRRLRHHRRRQSA